MNIVLAPLPVPPGLRTELVALYTTAFDGDARATIAHLEQQPGSELLVARVEGRLAGFKWSTHRRPGEVHSNLGVVGPTFRRRGIARALLREQHRRAREAGFAKVTTNTYGHFLPMLLLNLSEGLQVRGVRATDRGLKLLMERDLAAGSPPARPPRDLTLREQWGVERHDAPPPEALLGRIRFLYQDVFGEPFDPWFGHLRRAPGSTCWTVSDGDRLLGFKWGAPRSPREFHSHVGAVDPTQRQRGIGRALLHAQRDWATGRYQRLSTATFDRFGAMLRLNLVEGYRIEGVVQRGRDPMMLLALDL
jgi:ribosomal protein S18 acetylase RimI-like enzyme